MSVFDIQELNCIFESLVDIYWARFVIVVGVHDLQALREPVPTLVDDEPPPGALRANDLTGSTQVPVSGLTPIY